MADYLKLAPYRAGGAGRGCHGASFMSTLEAAVADDSHVTDTVDDDEADDEGDRGDDGDDESEGDNDDDDDEGDAGDVEEDSDVEDD